MGTSDHNHYNSGYPLLASTSQCDVIDGHVYWQHPEYLKDPATGRQTFAIDNTPMVDAPLNSTVVQLSRSAVAGKPYTVSETNHPFPNEYACEGVGILAAYAAFHDWDGVFFYTFEHKVPAEWKPRMPSHFEIRPDPVKMMNIAACAGLFLRGDVQSAKETIYRSYSAQEVRESIRLSSTHRPFFTPGFDPALPLTHGTRIRTFVESGGPYPAVQTNDVLVSDTGELAWHHDARRSGLVAVETARSQALIGFVKQTRKPLKNLQAAVENEFCSIVLTSLSDQPIAHADRLLLVTTARSANTGMKWNAKRTSLIDWGSEPTVIEPVKGHIVLRDIDEARKVEAIPLDSGAKAIGDPIPAERMNDGYRIAIGEPARNALVSHPHHAVRDLRREGLRLYRTCEDRMEGLSHLPKGFFLFLGDRTETHRQVQSQAKERFLAGRDCRGDRLAQREIQAQLRFVAIRERLIPTF